jgi:two-component system, NarL family, invasion response regulator UvrY
MAGSRSVAQTAHSPIEVLLVDSRQLVRAGIERVLADSGFLTVCAGVAGFDEAIRRARTHSPQLVVVNLPGATVDVLDGVRKMQRQFATVRMLILTEESDLIVQERLLQSGVAGVVNSNCPVEELYAAIGTVVAGERYVSGSLAQKLAERRMPGRKGTPFDGLTHRELQILLLVAAGRSAAAMARELCLTRKTVNSYRNRLLEKLQAGTDVELMHLALRHGLVRIP